MIKGTIYAVTDVELAMQCLQTSKVLYIGELNMNLPKGFIECSVLLPPYEAVSAEIDGNIPAFEEIYRNYLTFSEQCYGMFATILIALKNGINITMYIENGDNLSHMNFLLRYIEQTFGIVVGTAERPFSFLPEFNWQTAAILYSYMDGFISEAEFIYHQNNANQLIMLDQIHPFIKPVARLIEKYNLQNHPDIASWLNNYINMVKSYGAIVPGNMITIGKDE